MEQPWGAFRVSAVQTAMGRNLHEIDYAGACLQAHHVGGDYYDFLDLGQRRLALVIGDIAGKGTPRC